MASFGLILFLFVGVVLVLTGLPAYLVLIIAAILGAAAGVLSGAFGLDIVATLPSRLVGLLESDLLQALPLYVVIGLLMDRMGVGRALFETLAALLPGRKSGPLAAGLAIGALLGPMNGSVGASVLVLSRSVGPHLAKEGVPPRRGYAVIAFASTLGVVIPPSLVLILLGDAMLAAHTLAVDATGSRDRVINTQDVLRGALVPALVILALALLALYVTERRADRATGVPAASARPWPSRVQSLMAFAAIAFLVGILGAVALGRLYAVEAAASGAALLVTAGIVTGRLRPSGLKTLLADALATTGTLFAPLIAATSFTLVLRLLGTDKFVGQWVASLPGGETGAVAVTLLLVAVSALVLDAFEIIFVVVPILVPPLLMRVPDATWVAVLLLLTLQASFLTPPIGYAVLLARTALGLKEPLIHLMPAVAPFLLVQVAVLGLLLASPRSVHLLEPEGSRTRGQLVAREPSQKSRPSAPIAIPGPSLELPPLPTFETKKP